MIPEWFKAFPEYEEIQNKVGAYNPKLGYAGPESSKVMSAFIPETLYGIDCNLCFYQHDGLYAIGGDDQDRWKADCSMFTTALRIIEDSPDKWYFWGGNWARRHGARVRLLKYFAAVRSGGKAHFNFHNKS